MDSIFYKPHPFLRDIVHCIMVVDVRVEETGAGSVCVYPPTPQPSLFFYIGDPIRVKPDGLDRFIEQPRAVLVGQQSRRVTLDVGRDHKAVRVGFLPGGMYRLLGLPMDELLDGSIGARDVFGSASDELNEKLQAAESHVAIRDLVEAFLLQQARDLRPRLPFDLAMHQLLQRQGNMTIDHVAAQACLSVRQFECISRARLGMSPKAFARVVRFSAAYRMREERPGLRWTDIAYQCGYFDQMHLIRDFKDFAGMAPGVIERELALTELRLQANLRL